MPQQTTNNPVTGAQTSGGALRWYALSLALFVGALLSKTVVATLPAVILVIYWWKRGKIRLADVAAACAIFRHWDRFGLITLWMEKHNVGARGDEFDFSIVERMLIAGRAAWFYFGKLVWPYPLSFFYPRFAIDDHAVWQYAFPSRPWRSSWRYGGGAKESAAAHWQPC